VLEHNERVYRRMRRRLETMCSKLLPSLVCPSLLWHCLENINDCTALQ
jgi:hypothetical protein